MIPLTKSERLSIVRLTNPLFNRAMKEGSWLAGFDLVRETPVNKLSSLVRDAYELDLPVLHSEWCLNWLGRRALILR